MVFFREQRLLAIPSHCHTGGRTYDNLEHSCSVHYPFFHLPEYRQCNPRLSYAPFHTLLDDHSNDVYK